MIIEYNHMLDYKTTTEFLLQSTDKEVSVRFQDSLVNMSRKLSILLLQFWWILAKYNLPVTSEITFGGDNVPITNEVLATLYTKIYKVICAQQCLEDPTIVRFDIWESINDINNFTFIHCKEYHKSISIIDIIKLMKEPTIQAITDKVTFTDDTPSSIVEAEIARLSKELLDAINDPALENNVLYPYHRLGMINKLQLPQSMLAIGMRTDINDDLIRYPISSCFLKGLKNENDWMVESLSAKKVAAYLKTAIPVSQYFNRTCVLSSAAVMYMYPGDCGTPLTIPFYVYPAIAHNLVGKYHVRDGMLYQITDANYKSLGDGMIYLRSPTVCRHKDGTCAICGGELTNFLAKGIQNGIASTLQVTDPTTQKILSAKHLQITNSMSYKAPIALKDYFSSKSDKVYWKSKVAADIDNWQIGIPMADMGKLSDLQIIQTESGINEEHFSKIKYLAIKTMDDKIVLKSVSLDNSGTEPFFSKEMLIHIKNNYDKLNIGNVIWIPMKGFDISQPIFSSTIQNDSMLVFVGAVNNFLATKVSQYTSIPEALKEMANRIYSKVTVNIFHLEIMLKSLLITNERDMSVPVVQDIDNVRFLGIKTLATNRSLGTYFAYERLLTTIKNPATFILPRQISSFDEFVGFKTHTS